MPANVPGLITLGSMEGGNRSSTVTLSRGQTAGVILEGVVNLGVQMDTSHALGETVTWVWTGSLTLSILPENRYREFKLYHTYRHFNVNRALGEYGANGYMGDFTDVVNDVVRYDDWYEVKEYFWSW